MKSFDVAKDIYKLNNVINSYLSNCFKQYNITHLEARMLVVINESDDLNQEQLAFELNVSKNVVTQKITNLLKHNLIKRIEDKNDRRNKKLYLTKQGEIIVSDINRILAQFNASLLNNIGDFNSRNLEKNLKFIISNAKKSIK